MKCVKPHSFRRIIFLFLITLSASSCATQTSRMELGLPDNAKGQQILLMPMDIQLSTLTAGGVLKPEAEWTQNAYTHVEEAIRKQVDAMDIRLLSPEDVEGIQLSVDEQQKRIQLIKLYEAVGQSILTHQYVPAFNLPAKEKKFDWSIGPEAKFLKDKYGADYALFVYLRDSYASGGRVLTFLAVAALTGSSIQMGQQVGFGSVVDLNTGRIIWFNKLARGTGDLRTQKAAESSVRILLKDLLP